MDRQLIKALIDALEQSSLCELEYARDGESLRLVKAGHVEARPAPSTGSKSAVPIEARAEPTLGGIAIVSPLYGVVHLRPAPDAELFVAVGQAVATGQVLCTVEAMKVFTEVRAERPGTIEEVLVTSGQEVEPGQALIRLA